MIIKNTIIRILQEEKCEETAINVILHINSVGHAIMDSCSCNFKVALETIKQCRLYTWQISMKHVLMT